MKIRVLVAAVAGALAMTAAAYEWQVPATDGVCSLKIPHDAKYSFPQGFKATVRFACDLEKIGARSNHANLFCKGNDFLDGYCAMVRKNGDLLIDVKGIEPSYHAVPTAFRSGREYLLEVYVTPTCVRVFVDGSETGSYPYIGKFDFSNRHPLQLGSMGGYAFSGSLPSVKLEPLSAVTVPPGGPAPMLIEAPKKQARAEILWTKTICREEDRYIGWPTVLRLKNGDLIAAFSGDRDAHVCPWGKVQLVRSTDGGETWSAPRTIVNGPIDDRDAGLVQLNDGTVVLTYFTSTAYRTKDFLSRTYPRKDDRYWWKRHDEKLSDKTRKEALGYFRVLSTDDGRTWSAPEKMEKLSHTPHGPVLMNDGSLLQLGRSTKDAQLDNGGKYGRSVISAWRSTDKGATWECLCPDIKDTNDENKQPFIFHEPHCIQLPSGKIVGLVRYHGEDHCMRATTSLDGGRTWSPMKKTDMLGLPPHIIRLADGKLVCVYGRRFPQPTAFGEFAAISDDDGETWDVANEIVLAPCHNGDLGYPSSCVLADGSILTVYYQPPKIGEKPQLMATKWRLRPRP